MTFQEYYEKHFKLDEDGFVREIRAGAFKGNGLLQPVGIDALAALWTAAAPQWQPIETAPQGELVIVFGPTTQFLDPLSEPMVLAAWANTDGRWVVDDYIEVIPTHWMPLPSPPRFTEDDVQEFMEENRELMEALAGDPPEDSHD